MNTDFRERIIDGESLEDVALDAIQHYTDQILDVLNPLRSADHIFVITALRKIEQSLSSMHPRDAEDAGYLCEKFGAAQRSATLPAGVPEDVCNDLYRAMKRI